MTAPDFAAWARAIVTAAGRAGGAGYSQPTIAETVRLLADDLRDAWPKPCERPGCLNAEHHDLSAGDRPTPDPWFARGFREGAAGEGGGHGLIDIADAAAYAEGFAAGHRQWSAGSEDVPPAGDRQRARFNPRYVGACYFCDRLATTIEAGYAVCEPMFHDSQRRRLEDVAPADGYEATHWTADELHRHIIGGQTWEHAHEGGHEAHSVVSHDLSGAERVQ